MKKGRLLISVAAKKKHSIKSTCTNGRDDNEDKSNENHSIENNFNTNGFINNMDSTIDSINTTKSINTSVNEILPNENLSNQILPNQLDNNNSPIIQMGLINRNSYQTISNSSYKPLIYVLDKENKLPSLNDLDNNNKSIETIQLLPYAFIKRDEIIQINFDIRQNKLKLYNYWIQTNNPLLTKNIILNMFGYRNVYITNSFFFKKSNSYSGQKVILINKTPQRPYKFLNKLNRRLSVDKRTVKSVIGDYLISSDCILIILSNSTLDYICNSYYRYHKNEAFQISTLLNSLKSKFTCLDSNSLEF